MDNFEDLVRKMRDAQRGFFKSDPNSSERRVFLHESKRLEKMVDDYLSVKDKSVQQKLF